MKQSPRQRAKSRRSPRYVGAPCPTHGEGAQRYVTSKRCVRCDGEAQIARRARLRAKPEVSIVQHIEFQVPFSEREE